MAFEALYIDLHQKDVRKAGREDRIEWTNLKVMAVVASGFGSVRTVCRVVDDD